MLFVFAYHCNSNTRIMLYNRKHPPAILPYTCVCFHTLRLAKNLFKMLRQARKKHTALNLFGIEASELTNPNHLSSGDSTNCSHILGKCYKRKTRFREPIVATPLKQIDGKLHSIYSTLHCSEIKVCVCVCLFGCIP